MVATNMLAPGISPSPRYQHAAVRESFWVSSNTTSTICPSVTHCGYISFQVFVNARLHVSGGALGGGRMVEDSSSVAGWTGLI